MSGIHIKNGRVMLKDRTVDGAAIIVNDGKIAAVGGGPRLKKRLLRNDEVLTIDAKGCFVSPGFIDCHIHGEPEKIFFNEARHGTTAFVIAESCAPLNYIYEKAARIRKFIGRHLFGANVLGLRLEGPYISRAMAGAQNPSYMRKPDVKELFEILRRIEKMGTGCFFPGVDSRKKQPVPILKIMTIAPELKGAKPLIKLLRKCKIIASVGHSDATYESAVEGIDAGITHSTHTFNAMSGIDPSAKAQSQPRVCRGIDRRESGVVGAVLMDDRVAAEVILDFIHVHKALFELLLKLKKRDKVIIVSDSLTSEMGTGCFFPGVDSRKKQPVPIFTGDAYRFSDGRLAGSSLTMIGALKNAVKGAGLSLQEALNMITLNPAKLLGIEGKKGSIAAGKDADIVIFDKNFDVKVTMIRGKIAYRRGGF